MNKKQTQIDNFIKNLAVIFQHAQESGTNLEAQDIYSFMIMHGNPLYNLNRTEENYIIKLGYILDRLNNRKRDIEPCFDNLQQQFNTETTNVVRSHNNYFLLFQTYEQPTDITEYLKVYVPSKKDCIKQNAEIIFNYLRQENILHASKISPVMRNDNFVIRLTNMEDVKKVSSFINNNPTIQQGTLEQIPISFNEGVINLAKDNELSYNSEVSKFFLAYLNYLQSTNRLSSASFDDFKTYLSNFKHQHNKDSLKEIYELFTSVLNGKNGLETYENIVMMEKIIKPTTEKHGLTQASPAIIRYIHSGGLGSITSNKGSREYVSSIPRERLLNAVFDYIDYPQDIRTKFHQLSEDEKGQIYNHLCSMLNEKIKKDYQTQNIDFETIIIPTIDKFRARKLIGYTPEDQVVAAVKEYLKNGNPGMFSGVNGNRTYITSIPINDFVKMVLKYIELDGFYKEDFSSFTNYNKELLIKIITEQLNKKFGIEEKKEVENSGMYNNGNCGSLKETGFGSLEETGFGSR